MYSDQVIYPLLFFSLSLSISLTLLEREREPTYVMLKNHNWLPKLSVIWFSSAYFGLEFVLFALHMWLICIYKLIRIHVINFEAHLHMFIYKTLFFFYNNPIWGGWVVYKLFMRSILKNYVMKFSAANYSQTSLSRTRRDCLKTSRYSSIRDIEVKIL